MTLDRTCLYEPDEAEFRRHIEGANFRSGVVRGQWGLLQIRWPVSLIRINSEFRPSSPDNYCFRFDLSDYPQAPPNAALWDHDRSDYLQTKDWPGGNARFNSIFRPDWKEGRALYLPCDRLSIDGHADWLQVHPELIWTPYKTVVFYLNILYELLNSPAYTGLRQA